MKIIEYIEDFNEKDVYILKETIKNIVNNCVYVKFNYCKNEILTFTNIECDSKKYEIIPYYNLHYLHGFTSDNYVYLFYNVSSDFSYYLCLSNGYLIKEKSKYRQIITQMNINLPKELINLIKEYLY